MPDSAADHPADTPRARWPQSVRRRLAALGAVGMLMVALPLVQVLRFQNDALSALRSARSSLEPTAMAVDLHRSLARHRDLARRVLQGDAGLEPKRRQRKIEVDARIGELGAALAVGDWPHADAETDALRTDWLRLAPQISARTIDAARSDASHRLLIEQALQVIDDLGRADSLNLGAAGPSAAPQALQRMALAMAGARERVQALDALDVDARDAALAASRARIAALWPDARGHAAAVEPVAHWLAALRAQHDAVDPGAAADAVDAAERMLFASARAAAAGDLARRTTALRWQLTGLLGALLACAGAALVLVFAVPIGRALRDRRLAAAARSARAPGIERRRGGPPHHDAAGLVLRRLRDARRSEARTDPQMTLPPEP